MDGLIGGFITVLQPYNVMFCFVGALIGTLIGVLPGLGPSASIAMLLPLTVGLDPVTAIIMIAGIYYGASYGGSTTAILVNIPGEAQSVMTCIDGYKMAQQGRAGPAIGIAAMGSFIAGTLGAVAIALISMPLVEVAIKFGPPEYFALMLLGFVVLLVLAKGSVIKSLIMILAGLLLSMIGQDVVTGEPRFTFGITELADGVGVVVIAMGMFGLGEIFYNLERLGQRSVQVVPIKQLMPSREDWRLCAGPIARGSVLGFLIGLLPGGGATLASFVSYGLEKRLSAHPERFGKGAIEGVAGPETANNAGAAGSFIPLLTLGLPGNPVTAILLGAFVMYGVAPGPLMIQSKPEVFWSVVASMYVGNVMLLLLNLPLIGVWVQLLKVPYKVLYGPLILFIMVGGYSLNNSVFDLGLLLVFGLLGYGLRKLRFDTAPLILAYVLGGAMELNLRQTLMLGRGSWEILLDRPIALGILVVALVVTVLPLFSTVRRVLSPARAVNEL
ncbi:tripartite tricarboxylate transporter permease [Rhodoplanes sp. TEM]|uniref:Tripartite tricarboxylate transporter permease n=1 Tax=Rhodoplanes tepidamans TaxID=200616 RepID=A0ABT5J7J3_RHOTP|nr:MULTISPECIES: tripartite tricarboxylate transporter permease [Rhodoplanes]MDC7785619.1 tripartite tricarboxylate transporter permease [Rhodoplanes tepidamans]MDC7985720.1 tripartite tricarboxylate transporter permease [Rhodoplanes sp. TEM]MDQ0354815.1 putative tricarboxylic transport membrane protein [Rhodoplanes tepidamans]